MHRAVVAVATFALALALAACAEPPPPPDQAYARGADTLLTCENGGMVETVGGTTTEGVFDAFSGVGLVGATGAVALAATFSPDGTLATADGAWQPTALPASAHTACSALEQRSWWHQPPTAVPTAVAFEALMPGFATVDDCNAAKAAGTYPDVGRCYLELVVCPDGTASGLLGDVGDRVPYSISQGNATIVDTEVGTVSFTFYADGTVSALRSVDYATLPWMGVSPSVIADDVGCL